MKSVPKLSIQKVVQEAEFIKKNKPKPDHNFKPIL